ncbi:MAG: AAA family ATPase [bacterium]|nr:AAA family ATPase [bacterium]
MKRGLIIGKFLPFHEGHRHLIDSARAQVDEVHVLVCSLQREMIPGEQRFAWIRDHYADDPGVRVYHNPDENPQEPHEDPNFWRIWNASIRRFFAPNSTTPLPDILFSSESYGDELARVLGLRHAIVDPARSTVPISGTAVRKAPYHERRYLPEVTRAYFMKRIVITGPESCGKTTLASQLAEHYGTRWCHEYAREYLEERGIPVDDLESAHIPEIARGQAALEDRLCAQTARENGGVLFLDTDLIVTQIYAGHYFGHCPEWIRAEGLRRAARYDLQILLTPETPWVADELRNLQEQRDEMFEIFQRELQNAGAVFRVLPLPPDDTPGNKNDSLKRRFALRFEQAVRIVDEVLSTPARAKQDTSRIPGTNQNASAGEDAAR